MELDKFLPKLIIIGLFVFAIISFGVGFGTDNHANTTLLSDQRINDSYRDINSTLTQSQSSINESLAAFEADNPLEGAASLLFKSVPSGLKTIASAVKLVYNISFGLVFDLLGIPAIVGVSLSIILLVSILLLSWRVIVRG